MSPPQLSAPGLRPGASGTLSPSGLDYTCLYETQKQYELAMVEISMVEISMVMKYSLWKPCKKLSQQVYHNVLMTIFG